MKKYVKGNGLGTVVRRGLTSPGALTIAVGSTFKNFNKIRGAKK